MSDQDTDGRAETEHEALEAAQDALNDAKAAMKALQKAMRAMMNINTAASRHREANAAFTVRANARRIHGEIEVMHAEGTELLHKFWPEHAVPLQIRGGHR